MDSDTAEEAPRAARDAIDVRAGAQSWDDGTPMELAGARVEIGPPRLYSERYDVIDMLERGAPRHRVAAVALGLSWPKLRRRLSKRGISYRGNPAEWADAVIQILSQEGVTRPQYMAAGALAFLLIERNLPTDDAVAAAVGNSPAPTAGAIAK